MTQPAIVVFARVPQAGKVKTRLAAQLGELETLSAYRQLLGRTLHSVGAVGDVRRQLWIDGDDSEGECAGLARHHGLTLHCQPPGDLGTRMNIALTTALEQAPAALIVGTDCPGIDACYLQAALAALARVPVVLGPAEDGGYVLLGLRSPAPVFDGPAWGGPDVLATTRRLLVEARLPWEELPMRWDVDTLADYRRWQGGQPWSP